jgi:hypothetical protein
MFTEELNVRVFDTALDPAATEKVIYYRPSSSPTDPPLYRVWLYLDGPDLPFVDKVTYRLHPTFTPRDRVVNRTISNPNCRLEVLTWGIFEVLAIVEAKDRQFEIKHQLSYDRQFQDAVSRELPAGV